MNKTQPICRECGSNTIQFDAFSEWDREAQSFVLVNTFDDAVCQTCGYEGAAEWVAVGQQVVIA